MPSKSLPLWAVQSVAVTLIGLGAAVLYYFTKEGDGLKKLTSGPSKNQRQVIEVLIPKESVAGLIGRGGSNIKEIQEKSDTIIKFKDEDSKSDVRICVIRGTQEKTQHAEALIRDHIASQPKILIYKMTVDQKVCGRIIGRGGSSIRAMQASSGAKITLEDGGPDDDDDSQRNVIIRGTEAQIEVAKGLIQEKVDEDAENRRIAACSARNPRSPRRQLCNISGGENSSERSSGRRNVEQLVTGFQEGYIEVYVSAMKNPGRFWIQKVGPPSVELDRLVEQMTEFYNQEENRKIFKPKQLLEAGNIIATRFDKDGKWYRAVVQNVTSDDYDFNQSVLNIYFVDYGDDTEVLQEEICQLKMEFLNLRHQAIECSLAGVEPLSEDGTWSEDASDLFDELSHASSWVPVTIKVKGFKQLSRGSRDSSPVPAVDILSDETNIADELVSKGFAVRQEVSPNGAANGNSHLPAKPKLKLNAIPAGEERWSDDSEDDFMM